MKVYLLTDLEGVAGVTNFARFCRHDSPEYPLAKRLLTGEINACVEGICSVDAAAEIYVWDGHGAGAINIEELDERVLFIPKGPIKPPYLMDKSFDALFMPAQHAKAGTAAANLCHSYVYDNLEGLWLNGTPIGEIGCRAAIAGSFGVPLVFVSGDDKTIAEARSHVPDVVGVVVKRGVNRELAITHTPVKARALLRAGAAEAMKKIGQIRPFVIEPPYELKFHFATPDAADGVRAPTVERIDACTVICRADNLCDFLI